MFFSSWSFYIDRVGPVNLIGKMVLWGDKSLINLSKVQIEDNKKKCAWPLLSFENPVTHHLPKSSSKWWTNPTS